MKCKICGCPTDWDSSYGRPDFLVCGVCFRKLEKKYGFKTLDIVLEFGWIAEEMKKENE